MAGEAPKAQQSAKTAKPSLGPASESGDPAVHQLLAEQDIARRNGNDKEVESIAAKLAELGYE